MTASLHRLLRWPALLALATLIIPPHAHAQEQTAHLVRDANLSPATNTPPSISWVMPVGHGQAVFPRETFAHGKELWTSDGTPKGTRLLKDITPGPESSLFYTPLSFGPAENRKLAFFNFNQFEAYPNLWITDGTDTGTLPILETLLDFDSLATLVAGTTDGIFIEHWDNNDSHPDLYFSDGTDTGAVLLNPEVDGTRLFENPYGFTASGPWCYFIANEGQLWRSDGTTTGTTKLSTPEMASVYRLIVTTTHIIAHTSPESEVNEIWSRTLAGGDWTRLAPPDGKVWVNLSYMVAAGDDVFFGVQYIGQPAELWATDGTPAGTRKIPLVHQGSESFTRASGMTAWNGSVYLTAQNQDLDVDLWRTDGTAAGTERLAVFVDASPYVVPYQLAPDSQFLHFHSMNSQNEWELWRTGGTAATTRRVRNAPGSYPYFAQGPLFAEAKGGTFIVGHQGTSEEALWRTRGKSQGAIRLTSPEKASAPGITTTNPEAPPYEMLDGKLLALLETGSGHELWRMNPDGTRVRSLWKLPLPLEEGSAWIGFHGISSHGALFSIYITESLRQLWVTDGTKKGTHLLHDHGAGVYDAPLADFVKLGETWFYTATNYAETDQSSLWKTDGTPAGTTQIVTTDGTVPSPKAGEVVVFQDRVYFLAIGEDGKTGLWQSDGTAAGTILLKDTWLGRSDEVLSNLSVAAGKLLFTFTTTNTEVLWQSDGTAAGTVRTFPSEAFGAWDTSPALDLNGTAIFRADDQWWTHDANGTRRATSLPDNHLNDVHRNTGLFAVAAGLLFYEGTEANDIELWVTDGTTNGNRLVKDILPGPDSSSPREMIAVGNQIYFTADDSDHGPELWRSDGTAAGTVLVADIDPGPTGSWPQGLKAMNGKLYFSAQRRDVGRELFMIDLPIQ